MLVELARESTQCFETLYEQDFIKKINLKNNENKSFIKKLTTCAYMTRASFVSRLIQYHGRTRALVENQADSKYASFTFTV